MTRDRVKAQLYSLAKARRVFPSAPAPVDSSSRGKGCWPTLKSGLTLHLYTSCKADYNAPWWVIFCVVSGVRFWDWRQANLILLLVCHYSLLMLNFFSEYLCGVPVFQFCALLSHALAIVVLSAFLDAGDIMCYSSFTIFYT